MDRDPRIFARGRLRLRHRPLRPQRVRLACVLLGVIAGMLLPFADVIAKGPLESERFALDNGLDVVLHVDRNVPLVAVNLSYHVGSMHDGDRPGIAHLVEHLMFRGTIDVRDGELSHRLSEAGATRTNATTQNESTSYFTVIPADQLQQALWLESNRMAYMLPSLTEAKVFQEVKTTIAEWHERVGSRHVVEAHASLLDALFPAGHPLVSARPEQIRRLTQHDVEKFVRAYHGPANATLVLAGDLPSDVRDLVERYFGRRRGGTRPERPSFASSHRTSQRQITRRSEAAVTAVMHIGWPTPELFEPGDADAEILAVALEERFARGARGTGVGPSTHQVSLVGQSVFVITSSGGGSATVTQGAEYVDRFLNELRIEPLSAAEIARARRKVTVRLLRRLELLDARTFQIQQYVAAGKPPDWLDSDLERYEAVDAASVAAFVREYLTPERRAVVLVNPGDMLR